MTSKERRTVLVFTEIYHETPDLDCCVYRCPLSLVNSEAFRLPDSGQTKCYQAVSPYAEIPCAGTGQDGMYSINHLSYTDNGNGTVTDIWDLLD